MIITTHRNKIKTQCQKGYSTVKDDENSVLPDGVLFSYLQILKLVNLYYLARIPDNRIQMLNCCSFGHPKCK